MSNEIFNEFLQACVLGLNNKDQLNVLESISEHYEKVLAQVDSFYKKPKLIKDRAAFAKHKAFSNLPHYLVAFEKNFTHRGGKVIWAQDLEEANREILHILKQHHIKNVIKSNSSLADELKLAKLLTDHQIEILETELNSFVQQLQEQNILSKDYPLLEDTFASAADKIQQKLSLSENNSFLIIDFLRKYFINKSNQAQASITGANFLIADMGAVVICEEEGNIQMNTSFPDVHIVLSTIDCLIPSIADLENFLSLLSTHSIGKEMMWNTQILMGPKQDFEEDGPKEMYVVLMDAGRTEVLSQKIQRQVLDCIHCGACQAVCPVYKLIGPAVYDGIFTGPVGSIVTPYIKGFYKASHLTYACTLCGKCTAVCPMDIPLHHLILQTRNHQIQKGFYVTIEKNKMRVMKKMMLKRKYMDAPIFNTIIKMQYSKAFGDARQFPNLKQKSFHFRWKELHKDELNEA